MYEFPVGCAARTEHGRHLHEAWLPEVSFPIGAFDFMAFPAHRARAWCPGYTPSARTGYVGVTNATEGTIMASAGVTNALPVRAPVHIYDPGPAERFVDLDDRAALYMAYRAVRP